MSGKLKDLYVKRNQNQYQPAADSWEARAAELSNMSGGAMQQGETAGNGAFGWLKDSFDAGVAGVFGGTARLAGEFMPFGNDTLNSWADYFDDVARRNSPQPGQNLEGIDYVASAVGNALGSGAASALEAGAVAGLGSLLGAGGVAGTVLGGASKVIPGVGKAVQAGKTLWGSPVGKYLVANVAGSPFEAGSEAGNLISDMRKENQQGTANYTDDEIRDAALRSGALNLAWLTGMNMLEAGTLGKITGALGGKMAKDTYKGIAGRALMGGTASGIGEGAEEYGQNLIGDYSKRGSTADFNYDEALEAAKLGAIGGGVLGGVGSGLSATFSKNNSDVAEEIASEDGGTIEEAPTEENFWENKESAKHSIQQAYADGLISKDDARVMLMKLNDEELGEADKKRLKAREKQVAAAIESRRIQGYNDELDNYVNNYESGKEAFINAIGGQESGGDYGAVNGRTGASGKYQIMPENWPAWAEEAGIGADAEMTPENQEIVARYKLGEYYDKYGARGAAIAWYAGEGALDYSEEALNRKQGNGDEPSINEYADSVLARMGNVADNARIDDSEENYFDESNYTDDTIPDSLNPVRGFDVSHLVDEETQDARELFGEKQDENLGKQNLGNDFFSNIKVEQDKRAKAIKDIARAVSQPNTFDELRNSIPSNYLEQMQKARAVVPVNNNAVGRPIPSQTGTALTMQRGRNGGLNTDELAIMQKYQGNPDAFNRQFKKSVEAVRDAVNSGDITPDVGRAYMQNLGNMYNTVAGTVQNDGVILQGQDPAIIKMLGNLRDKRRRGDTGALPSLLQENGNADRSAAFANRNNPLAPLNLPVKTPKGWDKAEAEYKARAEEKAEKHTRQQTIADIVNARAAQKWDEAETEYVSSKKGIDITLPKGVTVDTKFAKNKKTGKKEVELKFSGEKISDEFKKKLRAHGFNWNVGRKAWVAEENIVTKAVADKLTQKDNGEVKNGKEETEHIDKTEERRGAEGDAGETRNSEAEQAEAEHVPESNQDEVNKKTVSVEENIANGKKAIEKVISEHSDAIDAMTRDDVGGISFYYGTPGRGKKFKKGYGIAHMIAKRNSEGLDGETFVKRLPEVIAKGKITERQTASNGDRVLVKYGDITTVLSLYKDGNRQTWVVTGWDDSVFENKKETTPSDAAAVYDANSATSEGTTRSRSNTDEAVSFTKSVAQPAENVKKINLPKGTTVDVSIVGDNSNIIQVKFNGAQGKGTGGILGRAGYVWKKDKQVWQARKTEKALDVAEQLGYKPTEEMSEDKSQQTDKYKNYSKEDIKINKERLATMPDVDGILQPAAKKFAEFFKAHFPKSDYTYETVDFWNNYILEFEQLNKILKKYRQATQQGDLSAADAYFQQISSSLDRLNNLLGKLVDKDKEEQQAQMRQEFRDSIIPFFDEYNKIVDKHNAKEDAKKASKAKKQQNQGKQEYKYYLNARPADIGAVPKGFIRVDTEDKGGRYGAIYYDRQLNDTDVQQYELKSADDVEKEKAQKEALETVSKELLKSDKLKAQAKNNSIGDFVLAYRDAVDDYLAEHVDENPAYTKLLNNPEIADEFFESESIIEKAYDKLKASDNSQDVVQSNKGNTNEGGNNNGIDITGKLSSNDTGSRRAENEIRTTSSSEESSESNGQGSRTLEGQSGRNGNNGVPGSRTAVGGKTSISKGSEQVSAVRENPARSAELSGSVVDSLQEQPNVDEGSTDKIVESVADGRTDAADTVNQKVNEVVKENNLDRQRADRLRKTAKVMPFLSKIQFSNTDFVADRLADNGKQGVMITDGTGTGKTFSGLAVAKEMVEDGKENILIVTPSDSVNNQWANAAKDFFGIKLSKLDNIQDAGKGAVITTYANLGANDALIKRDWDLVICDESHYLMNNEQGEKTAALAKLRQLTLHPRELRARAEERILPEEKLEARRTIAQAAKLKRKKGQLKASEEAIVEKAEKLQKEKADELSKEERAQVEAQVKDWEQLNATEKPKVMFMSATPFAYVPDIDYAEGYLFDYPKVEGGSYNQPGNGFQQFMIEHFGYHMRYNKLTKPDKAVDNAVMEVEFHEWLRKTGALTGHELEIDKDYNRGFLLVDQGVGKKIDEGFEFLRNNHDKYRELEGVLNKQFDSRRRNYLLESIKARESVPIIQQYLKAGKKVVVFYETNVERESFNPFKFTQQTKELLQSGENRWTSEEIQREMEMFAKERPDLVNLNLDELSEPISIYREAFGDDAMFFNGRVSKNKRAEYVKAFNDDNSGKNLIFVQQDAGNAGISLHDTTGKHQRVLINIGIPRRPSYAIQIEGRIYRLGNKSNAIIRYLTTATNIENGLFAETVAGRASTAENLALGRRARGLRDSFKNAYQEIFDGTWEDRSPGTEGEDVGGKENDRNIVSTDSDYDRAKAFYFARGKKTAKNKAAEGVDYFATPEPVGYKMVQWAGLKDGDRVLEPSAGHGAISRFFSPNTDNTIIEPSSRLAPQAQMNTDNAKLINGYFEDLHIGNKYDAVTMNPPFGTGGKTAIEHVAKAFKHLRNGGRVIAIIPRGAMADKRFDAWYESDDAKDAHMVGEVLLPGVTFERAGTKVATRIVIIDKGGESQGVKRIDLSRINNINELFDNLESVEMPARQTKQADAGTANFANSLRQGDAEGNSEVVTADSYKHTKTGAIIPSAKLNANLSDEEYRKVKSIAGKNGGYYSRYAKAFLFQDNETGRDKFVEEVNGANNTQYSVYSEAVQRVKEEVEAEIRAAFPNGKVEYVNGVPTITMPNGSKFQYSIRENIVVNAKEQRKADAAHGTSGARVQGFWKKFTGNGVQRMLAVSQNSERGTAFHEAMHAAIDLVLTEKEKNALYNYYEMKAKEQKRDVDEVIADAYRDWVLARQRKSGTMFGKLWRKVKDFCTRIKAIFDKGAEVERIMQDIESGRVYERGTNNHSVTKRISFSKEEIQGQKGSGTTQVATTRTMYVKALKWLRNQSPEAKTVLDYGAGLGLGTDDMRSNNPDLNIDCYEPNPERWAGKQPPTYTNNTQINKDYDLILNTNVLNVVEKPIRDLIVKDIADHLTMGGKALITTRGWSNDVNAAKNFKPADEHHAIWINKGKNGYVFQKGFDGDELKNYIEELLGDEFVVEKTRPTFGKSSVTITRVKAQPNKSAKQLGLFDTDSYQEMPDSYKTLKGSVVKRSKYGVGKQMGSQVYLHKDYVSDVIPKKVWENALKVLSDADSDFEYNCVMYDTKTGNVRFDEAPDFDESREPIVGDTITVKPDGTVKRGHSNYIWHHKWLWVKNDYQGFDVNQSKAWSNKWLGTLTETADGNGIERWNTQLDRFNLEHDGEEVHYSVASPKHKIANAFTNTERKGVVDSAKDFFKEHRKSLYQDWFDKNNPLKDFDALTKATGGLSVYDQVQSLPATIAGMLKALTEGTAQHIKMANQHLKNVKMKYNVTLAMALEKIDKKQMDKAYPKYLAENGFDNWVNALGAYLGAERCLEMARLARAEGKTYKFPKGLTEQECQEFVKKAPQQFKAAADIFYKVNDNVISIMEDAEVFSHDLAKTLRTKYRKYCPLLRDFSDTAAADSFIGGLTEGGRGIGNVSVPLKRINIEGSERGVLNPLETILKSYAVMLNRAERNKVALMAVENSKTADLHELIQEVPGTTADPKNCVFTVLINGKKKAYKTTQDLYGPIVGYNLPAANLAFGVARTAARMLRTGATMSPSFILRNVLRDTVSAGISSKNGFIPIVDTIRGAIALAKDPAMRAEFEAAGVTEYNFYSSQKSRIKSLDAMAGETPASAWEIMKAVFSRLEATSDFFESSTRMGEYMKARQKGLSMEEAARAAREVTLDFSRSGRVGEQVNQVVPFFNACLQGGDKMVRLFREDFVGTSLKVFKYIVLPSLLIMAMNWDEDWYKDLDPDIKNNYWCLGRNIRIPKPQEAGVLFGSGIEALFQQAADKDKDAVSNFLKAFSSNMMPSVLPTLILPLIEWSANYSFFKGRPLVGNKYSRLPDELQYNDYTSELSKGIGSALKVSPMKIDNLVRGYTGTMGALLWSMAGEPFAKANNLPAKHFSELPFVRDFNVTDANLSRPMNEFYGILDKANRQHAGYGVKGKPEAAVKGIRSAGSMISKIRKDIDKITHSNLTPERKRELIDKRKEKMNQIAKQATARYGKYFE